jgi:hypothetical protein
MDESRFEKHRLDSTGPGSTRHEDALTLIADDEL